MQAQFKVPSNGNEDAQVSKQAGATDCIVEEIVSAALRLHGVEVVLMWGNNKQRLDN